MKVFILYSVPSLWIYHFFIEILITILTFVPKLLKKKAPFLFWNAPSIASRFKNEKSTGILQLLFQMIPRLMSFNQLGN